MKPLAPVTRARGEVSVTASPQKEKPLREPNRLSYREGRGFAGADKGATDVPEAECRSATPGQSRRRAASRAVPERCRVGSVQARTSAAERGSVRGTSVL